MDPIAVFGRAPVFVHAHPDDESISTGGTIAALVEAGAAVTIVTGTRGERGEVVPGQWHHLEGTEALGPHRVHELRAALAALAPVSHSFLGPRAYADSGMQWGEGGFAEAAADAPADALSRALLDDVVGDLMAVLPTDATSVVGYDALGGYGHPDHVRMHEAGLEVARRRGLPYFAIVEPRVDRPTHDGVADDDGSEGDIAIRLTAPQFAVKLAAMAAHATQLTVSRTADGTAAFTLSGGQTHPVAVVESFTRLR